jgi:hypothetical protein
MTELEPRTAFDCTAFNSTNSTNRPQRQEAHGNSEQADAILEYTRRTVEARKPNDSSLKRTVILSLGEHKIPK